MREAIWFAEGVRGVYEGSAAGACHEVIVGNDPVSQLARGARSAPADHCTVNQFHIQRARWAERL